MNAPETIESRTEQIKKLGPWFHNLHLPDGTQTAPDHFLGDFPTYKWKHLLPHLPSDLSSARVLDIGCNGGFYSIELATRGAIVDAIDVDEHYLRQARWAARQFHVEGRIKFAKMQVYDLASFSEQYDVVLFMGVFYHLRYPALALDIVANLVGNLLVFQTLTMPGRKVVQPKKDYEIDEREVLLDEGWPKMAFVEHTFAGDPTNWWIPNHACVEAILRSAGMKVTAEPGHEMYLCQPDRSNPSARIARLSSDFRPALRAYPQVARLNREGAET